MASNWELWAKSFGLRAFGFELGVLGQELWLRAFVFELGALGQELWFESFWLRIGSFGPGALVWELLALSWQLWPAAPLN